MIKVKLDVNFDKEAELMSKRVSKAISNSMYDIGVRLVNKSRSYFDDEIKIGRVYRIRIAGSVIEHQASAPEQSPANLTGALKDSIRYRYAGGKDLIFRAGNNRVPYARAMELGNPLNNTVKRPYLVRAIYDLKNTNYTVITNNIKKVIR